jgi:dipeptidyl aminopeptidase/acylaminoacyl peptidase
MRRPTTRSFVLHALALALAAGASAGAGAPAAAPAETRPGTAASTGPYRGHGAQSVPAEVLETYAPGPIPADLRSRIETYLDVRAPDAGVTSPDGKRLYFTWSITGTSQVWRLDGPDRFPVQMTGGEDSTSIAAVTPDGRWLVLSRDRKGEEDPGLYLQSPDGGPLTPIRHDQGVQVQLQWVSDDSRFLWFSANDVEPSSRALYRYDLVERRAERRFAEPGLWSVADARPGGRPMLLARAVGSRRTEYWEWDPESGERRPLLGVGDEEEYRARFGPGDGELLVLTPRFGEFRRLHRFRGGTFEPLTPERAMDVASFDIDHRRERVLVRWNDGGYFRLEAFAAATFAPVELPTFAGADSVAYGATSRDGRFTTIQTTTARAPAVSYVYGWERKELTRWHAPSVPEVDLDRFAVPTLEHYPARDGTLIPMWVRRPETCAADPCPVVIMFHGGPEGQALPGFSPRAQLVVDEGFVLVEPNVRGSDGYGKSWFRADDGRKRLDVITDIEDAARHVREAWAKDGRAPKVGVYGGSYGGYSALVGMTMFASSYDAGVSVVGVANLLTFLDNTAPYRRILRTSEYGDPIADRDALERLSPVRYLDRVRGPILLVQGASDPRVPVGEAVQMRDALAARGLPVELVIFADEGHGARKRSNQVLQLGHALRFFRQHLLGAAPAAGDEAAPAR